MILGFMKYLLKNLFLIFYKRQKCSIILNYHRIGRIDPENPFHRLHTVSFYVFKMQMRICRLIGKIVSLDDIKNSNLSSRIDFAAVKSSLRDTTTRILSSLTPREERVLRMRFGIGMNSDHTLEEVGQQFSVTRERIRQIEAKALRKLKHPTRARKLKTFLDE